MSGTLRLGLNASFQNISCSNQFRGSLSDNSNAPAFTWEGNENTGMFHHTSNVIGLSIDGGLKMIIGSNIGVNNSIPQFPLDVNGAIRSSSNIYCGTIGSSNNPCYSWAHNSNTGLFNMSTNVIGVSTGGTNIMTIGSNIGIGTSNPIFRLHNAFGSIFIGNASLASTTIPSSVAILSSNVANGHRLVFDNSYNGTAGAGMAANKIVLHNNNSWLGGFGLETDAVTYHSGNHHRFYVTSGTSYGTLAVAIQNSGYTMDVTGTLRTTGDTALGTNNGKVYISGNLTGNFMAFHDDLWFNDPQNGSIQIKNGGGNDWGTMVGYFNAPSSRTFKKNISILGDPEIEGLYQDTLQTNICTFLYNEEAITDKKKLGIILEDSPSYLSVSKDGTSLYTIGYVAMLHGAIKKLDKIVKQQAERISALEARL